MTITYNGAAIMPWTVLADNQQYYMLGRIRPGTGKDNGTWDDWGGAREERDEQNPIKTASREATEESMGLLGYYSSSKYLIHPQSQTPHAGRSGVGVCDLLHLYPG